MTKGFETTKGKFAFIQDNNIANLGNSSIGVYAVYNNGSVLPYIKNAESLGNTKDLTEEQWEKIVTKSKKGSFFNYIIRAFHSKGWSKIFTATDSGKSLMESLELGAGNWFLVKFV